MTSWAIPIRDQAPLGTLSATRRAAEQLSPGRRGSRRARHREYLMCPPDHFAVTYAINPWMDPSRPVDLPLARAQWQGLVDTYRAYGHEVQELRPVPGLPDMVFAANGATVVDDLVLQARFAYPERSAEAAVHAAWHREQGRTVVSPVAVNEAEGDFAVLASRRSGRGGDGRVLAGWGFRTERAAHRELAELTGCDVVGLELVDPRFYHLDVCLGVLDDRAGHIAYYPPAFGAASRSLLAELYPDALVVDEADAVVFGLNLVSDGRHVFLPAQARGLAAQLRAAGYRPVPIELSELTKGGGSVKCCTQEIRRRDR